MNPVYATAEFWAALVGQIIGILVLTGTLTADQGEKLKSAAPTIVGGLISALTLFGFIKAQAVRKAAAASLMVARLQKHGGDPLRVEALSLLDAEARNLLKQL